MWSTCALMLWSDCWVNSCEAMIRPCRRWTLAFWNSMSLSRAAACSIKFRCMNERKFSYLFLKAAACCIKLRCQTQRKEVREKRGAVPVADQKCMVQCHCCAFLLHLSHPIQVLKTPPWNQNTATLLTYDPLKLLKLNPCLTTTHLKPTLCQQIWC
jgi:hypothetical protein